VRCPPEGEVARVDDGEVCRVDEALQRASGAGKDVVENGGRRCDVAVAVVPGHLQQGEDVLDPHRRFCVVTEHLDDPWPNRRKPLTTSDRHAEMISDGGVGARALSIGRRQGASRIVQAEPVAKGR
jgi:hypothetical protein